MCLLLVLILYYLYSEVNVFVGSLFEEFFTRFGKFTTVSYVYT